MRVIQPCGCSKAGLDCKALKNGTHWNIFYGRSDSRIFYIYQIDLYATTNDYTLSQIIFHNFYKKKEWIHRNNSTINIQDISYNINHIVYMSFLQCSNSFMNKFDIIHYCCNSNKHNVVFQNYNYRVSEIKFST